MTLSVELQNAIKANRIIAPADLKSDAISEV
jgi:hypothetical protein